MRYLKSYQKFKFAGLFLICLMFTLTLNAQDQTAKKASQIINVVIKVVDEAGNPVPDAQVVINGDVIRTETDTRGSLTFNTIVGNLLTVTSKGYEKNVTSVEEILKNNTVTLRRSKLFMTNEDNVPLPFTTLKKRNITGSSNVIMGSELEMYPSNDIRNAFTGLVNGVQVKELNGQPGISAEEGNGTYNITEKINISARGNNMMYIIDDVPIDVTEMTLDPQEIMSVTFIKDIVGKAMFGPAGANGIIFIKTKRGVQRQRTLNVNVEDGVSVIDRMPGWTSGADYARLNNQARLADGLESNYNDNDIAAYGNNDPYDMYHPNVNYRDMILKSTKSFKRANVSSSGGNDMIQYFSYLGYNSEGDIYKIGPKSDYNRLTMRSNLDVKINDQLKVQFDIYGNLSYRRSPNFGYTSTVSESGSQTDLVEMNSVLRYLINTPPIEFPVYANNDPSLETPWYGVSSRYTTSPIGNMMGNGYYTETGRNASTNVAVEYDLGHLIEGLKSRTFFGFNVLNLTRIGKAENYSAYIVNPSLSAYSGLDTILLTKAHDGFDMTDNANLHDYYLQRFTAYENLSYNRSFGKNDIQSTLTAFLKTNYENGTEEPVRALTGVWTGSYSYNSKYIIQGVLNYSGTYVFNTEKRWKLFPSVGAGWVVSEEGFMSDVKFIDYLKLRAEAGIMGNESFFSPYYYKDSWSVNSSGSPFGPFSTNQWFGSATDPNVSRTSLSRIGNANLSWEESREFNAGIDALLFKQKLLFEVNYYNRVRYGMITQISNSLPTVIGLHSAYPFYNYNNAKYYGLEIEIQYTNNIGDFRYSIGSSATIQNTERLKYDEPNYRNDYQYRVGGPVDAYFGQVCLGKFTSDEEALEVPQVYDAVIKEGDLKYKDINGDGFVDDNDMSEIGHTTPRLYYALNAKLSYKSFDFTVVGTGFAFYDIALTNKYYFNGWGDDNYSNFVKDNIGGAYPRLTYYKVNNNFVASDFWLTKGGYFKIQNVELAYNLPLKVLQYIGGRDVRVYVRGANLLTISKLKDVDPESINSGITSYPLFRTFTGGVKLIF